MGLVPGLAQVGGAGKTPVRLLSINRRGMTV